MILNNEITGPVFNEGVTHQSSQPIRPGSAIHAKTEVPNPLEIWQLVWNRKGTLLAAVAAGSLLGFGIAKLQKPVYESVVGIEMVGLNDNFMNAKNVSPIEEQGATTEASDLQTELRLLQSSSLLARSLQLCASAPDGCWASGKQFRSGKQFNAGAPNTQREIEKLAHQLEVKVVPLTRIIEIHFAAYDPKISAAFANTLSDEFIRQSIAARRSVNQNIKDWLTGELDTLRGKLQNSEDQLQQYARSAHLLLTSDKGDVAEGRLRQLQQDLSVAHADRIARQARQEIASENLPEAVPEVLNDPGLKAMQVTLTQLQTQLANLDLAFTPEHYRLKRVKAQITSVEQAMNEQRTEVLNRVQNEYKEAVRRENLLSASYEAQLHLLEQDSERAIQYNILKREVESNRQLYDAMLQHLKEATLATAITPSNLRIVDHAVPPRSPARPNISLFALIGSFTGLLGGITYLTVSGRTDRTVRESGEIGYYLHLPELGIIPSASRANLFRTKLIQSNSLSKNLEAGALQTELHHTLRGERRSAFADSFRSTLISLMFTKVRSRHPSVIVITSPGIGEGKSTVTCNLALASAELGHRVLLIDADLRRPTLHTYFNISNETGLTNALQNDAADLSILRSHIHSTSISNLSIMPSGRTEGIGTNLIYGKQMQALLETLRSHYDLILIDTPPVLHVPDARVLGRLVDGVVAVVRANVTTRDAVLAACQRLREDGVFILGTVLNDWNPKLAALRYYEAEPVKTAKVVF